MKKQLNATATWVAAVGALALLVAGCDLLPGNAEATQTDGQEIEATQQQYSEDGRPLINLSVSMKGDLVTKNDLYNKNSAVQSEGALGGPDQALFADMAKAFNFYEVVFKDPATGGKYYAKSARLPNEIKMSVPAGTYTAHTNSTLLLGNYNNGEPTLLGVGVITTPASGVIATTTTSVSFTVTALVFDAMAGTDAAPTTVAWRAGPNPAATAGFTRKFIKVNNVVTPYFTGVTSTATAFNGNFVLGVGTGTTYNALAAGGADLVLANGTGTGTYAPPVPKLNMVAQTLAEYEIIGSTGFTAASILTATPAPAIAATNFTIPFTFTPATTSTGLVGVSIDIPVVGLNGTFENLTTAPSGLKDNPNATVWHIKLGAQNAALDTGATAKSLGGAILFEIGNTGMGGFAVTLPTIP